MGNKFLYIQYERTDMLAFLLLSLVKTLRKKRVQKTLQPYFWSACVLTS